MEIEVFGEDTVAGRLFAAVEEVRKQGKLGKSVNLTRQEYDTLLKETDTTLLMDVFGMRVLIDGKEVPDPMAELLEKMATNAIVGERPKLLN